MSENTQIALPETFKPEVFKSLIDKAPQVFIENKTSVEKAVAFGNNLLAQAQAGMNDELDTKLNNYLVRVKDTIKLMNDKRSPITSMFTAVSKLYTGLEATIDPAKPESIYSKIQKHRNDYATAKAQKAAQERAAADRKLREEQELIAIRSNLEMNVRKAFDTYLNSEIDRLQGLFNGLTLENFKVDSEQIKNFGEVYLFTHFENIGVNILPSQKHILIDVKTGKYEQYKEELRAIIQEKKAYYIDRITSKYRELHEIANAQLCDAEKAQLAFEAQQREAAEKAKLEKEAAERQAQEAAKIEANKTVLTANTLFDIQSSTSIQETAQVRSGYEITVTHPAGYQLIVAKYFEKEGMLQPIDVLEKKTLGQMKTFCEKLAKDKDEKIVSPYLRYKETFKAVNKRG